MVAVEPKQRSMPEAIAKSLISATKKLRDQHCRALQSASNAIRLSECGLRATRIRTGLHAALAHTLRKGDRAKAARRWSHSSHDFRKYIRKRNASHARKGWQPKVSLYWFNFSTTKISLQAKVSRSGLSFSIFRSRNVGFPDFAEIDMAHGGGL